MLVVDASVMVEMFLRTPDAAAIEDRLFGGGEAMHAPHLIDVEVTQVLRRYVRAGDLSSSRAALYLGLLGEMPLTRHAHAPLMQRIWDLRDNATAYDAAYVALAEALGATLITRDRALSRLPGVRVEVEII